MTILRPYGVLLLAGLVLFGTGCDSGGDDEPRDAERILGTWTVSDVSDADGSQQATFAQNVNRMTVVFNADATFRLTVDAVDDAGDQTLDGPYSLNEALKKLTVTATLSGQPVQLAFDYAFRNETTLALSASSVLINPLLGTNLAGTVTLTLTKS
ncbi:MAG: hypothetical protein D6746_13750 [Bacteroidetes bacterium]|nr:MAG: hypothetical protein D6746_13750 [Bacteroidota bacterium]GIV57414.1 MAG: hypothetical protein KatS3mg042_0327 [Rhodothermaceae bacterium]